MPEAKEEIMSKLDQDIMNEINAKRAEMTSRMSSSADASGPVPPRTDNYNARLQASLSFAWRDEAPQITIKQVDLIQKLMDSRDIATLPDHDRIILTIIHRQDVDFNKIKRTEASRLIDALFAIRPTQTQRPSATVSPIRIDLEELPLVRFAMYNTNTNELMFFEITEKKWVRAGETQRRRFINRLVGAPGAWHKQFLPVNMQQSVARGFVRMQYDAIKLYADNFTVCAKCDSPLSDERSRAARLGPTCAKKLGYAW